MRPATTALTGLGYSPPIPLDINQSPFAVSVAVSLSPLANLTYTVEHTFDDIYAPGYDPNAATSVWFPQSSLTTKTQNAEGNYSFPVRAVRLTLVNPYTSGQATMTVIQAGMPGR